MYDLFQPVDAWRRYSLRTTVQPAVEPVSLDDFKLSQRISWDDEDSLLLSYLLAARVYTENYCRRRWITQTCAMAMDFFPGFELRLPIAPVQSIAAITYTDYTGTTQTLSSSQYLVDLYREPARITPIYGGIWPITREQLNAAQVSFVCGYGGATAVPELAKRSIVLLAANWYENREPFPDGIAPANIPFSIDAMLTMLSYGTYP